MTTAIVRPKGSRSATASASSRARTARCATRSSAATRRVLRARSPAVTTKTIWALRDVSFDVPEGEVLGVIGQERRRQVDAAEDPDANHDTDRGSRDDPRPGRQPARGRDRFPSGADGPRERLPERLAARHEAARDHQQVPGDRRVRRCREVHRHPGQALLERDVRAARVRGRRAPRARDPARRRGARRRRRGVPAPLSRADGGHERLGSHGAVRLAQHAGGHAALRPRDLARRRRGRPRRAEQRRSSRTTCRAGHGQRLEPRVARPRDAPGRRSRPAALGARDPGRTRSPARSTCASRSGSRSGSPCCGTGSPSCPKIKVYDRDGDVAFNALDTEPALAGARRAGRLRLDRVDSRRTCSTRASRASTSASSRSTRRSSIRTPGRTMRSRSTSTIRAEGDSARGLFTGQFRGVVRPLLEWSSRSVAEPADRRHRPRAQRGRLRRAGDPQRRRVLRPDPCGRSRLDRRDVGGAATARPASYDHLDVRRARHAGDSHTLVEPYAGTDTWVFGVDGDELYDPARLAGFREELLGGAYDDVFKVASNVLNCVELDREARTASGYLSPPSRSITKLYNFARDRVAGAATAPSGSTAGRSCSATATTSARSTTSASVCPGTETPLRCLHACFLRRSTEDPSARARLTGRPILEETGMHDRSWRGRAQATSAPPPTARRDLGLEASEVHARRPRHGRRHAVLQLSA